MGLKFDNFVRCLPNAIRHQKAFNFLSKKKNTYKKVGQKSHTKRPRIYVDEIDPRRRLGQ